MKNFKLLLVICCTFAATAVNAQVKGVSYTLSPAVEYVDWNRNTAISNGYFVGGQLGFGFGQYVELRGNYLQSINLKRDFSNFNLDNFQSGLLADEDIKVERYGGELKLNLARGGIVPFIAGGAGVQNIKRASLPDSSSDRKNIYFTYGGGLQFSLGDRYTLALQALNTAFTDSPVQNLLGPDDRAALGIRNSDFENKTLQNWSYRASILLYLGGRRPGELTDTDKAYLENFSSGFKGLSLPIEVTAGQLNFGKSLPYSNAKYTGVSTGFDFGEYVGIRAFYWRTMEDGYFSTFDRLAVYGGEGKFKLSNGNGLLPYINVGGGVIDALDGYEIGGAAANLDNTPFVSGGLGIDLPVSRYFKFSGYAKALLTSNDPLETTTNPDELTTSMAYGASVNFIIGARSKDARQVFNSQDESYDSKLASNMNAEKGKASKLKKDYQERIKELDTEIDKAFDEGDTALMEEKYRERESAQRFIKRVEDVEKREAKSNKENGLDMNPTEFRDLIEELKASQQKVQDQINDRLDDIENSLQEKSSNKNRSKANRSETSEREQELQDEIDKLRKTSRKKNNDGKTEISDREQELQDELDKMKENARKKNSDASSEVSDREQELQNEVDELKKEVRKNKNNTKSRMSDREQDLQAEIDRLKRQSRKKVDDVKSNMSEREQELEDEIEELKKAVREKDATEKKSKNEDIEDTTGFRLGDKRNRNGNQNELGEEFATDDNTVNFSTVSFLTDSQRSYVSDNLPAKEDSSFFSKLNYDGSSAIGGFNIGGNTTFNLGVRSHYRYGQTNFYLMPEAFFGFGNPASFGLFANAVYQLDLKNENFSPYAGLGAGVLNIGDRGDTRTKLAANLVVGTYLFKVGNGRFYADLSARNFFKYNQVVAGYRLPF